MESPKLFTTALMTRLAVKIIFSISILGEQNEKYYTEVSISFICI